MIQVPPPGRSVLDPDSSVIININNSDSVRFAIELPMIKIDNGPFRSVWDCMYHCLFV